MLPNIDTSLTEDQKASLEAARKIIPAVKREIKRAKQAGIDVSAQEAELAALEANLNKLYNVYVRNITTGATGA